MKKLKEFLQEDVWKLSAKNLPPLKAFWIRFLRILLLTRQVFSRGQLEEGACTLTYYTILGLIPTVILLLGIARGFLLEDFFIKLIQEKFNNQNEILKYVIPLAQNSLKEVRGDIIALFGLLLLAWSAVKIIKHLEITLNLIWEVKQGRSLIRQITDYLAILLFAPLLFFISNGLVIYLSAKTAHLKQEVAFFQQIDAIVFFFLNLLPYLLNCVVFVFLYVFIPHTKVRFSSALYAGLIAGALYHLIQWAYLYFQIGVTQYNPLYGTFAAIPFFLVWMHLSWIIVLLGGKLAFSFQNVDAYEFLTPENFTLSHKFESILSLCIVHSCVQDFCEEKKPPTASEISSSLTIPLILTKHLLDALTEGKILSEVTVDGEEEGYQPALEVNKLTIKKVLDMIDSRGGEIPLPATDEVEEILRRLNTFHKLIERSDANIALKDL